MNGFKGRGTGFLPMPPRERRALVGLVLFSTAAFLPVFGRIELGGVAVFGWFMAALLVGSPLVLLALLRAERMAKRRGSR